MKYGAEYLILESQEALDVRSRSNSDDGLMLKGEADFGEVLTVVLTTLCLEDVTPVGK